MGFFNKKVLLVTELCRLMYLAVSDMSYCIQCDTPTCVLNIDPAMT